MRKIQRHIQIVRSTTPGLSSLSQKSANAIMAVLKRRFTNVGVYTVNNRADLLRLIAQQPDLVFMGMKYLPGALPGQKIWISRILDKHGILHTGSAWDAIECDFSKPLSKQRVRAAGIATARSVVIKRGHPFKYESFELKFPAFVKPASLGGGNGINPASKVENLAELKAQVNFLLGSYKTDVLIEEYLPGREFSVAMLQNLDSGRLQAMPIELIAPHDSRGDRILSKTVKSLDQEKAVAVTDPVLRSHVIATATNAFNALSGRDYGRIDLRLDSAGEANFLEANLIPSLISGYSSFPKACMINQAMGYDSMIHAIVDLAFDREVGFIAEPLGHTNTLLSPVIG